MSKKRFSDRPVGTKRVDFEIDFWNGDRAEPHSFNAYPAIDTFAIARINKLSASDRTAVEALGLVKDAIRTLLDDNDGTPLDWTPSVLPREAYVPGNELTTWPSDEPESGMGTFHSLKDESSYTIVGGLDDEEDAEPQFLAPDSTVHPWSDAPKFTDFAAGSSRRRWVGLMDGDNDLRVEAKTVTKLWQWLISEAADRPTVR